MQTGLRLKFSKEQIEGIISSLQKYLDAQPTILEHREINECMRWAYLLNLQAVQLQSLSKKLKFLGKPLWTAPSWLAGQEEKLLSLHGRIGKLLLEQEKQYDKFRYSFGYPYQSFDLLNIFGGRETEERYDAYGLDKILSSEDTILDIGANSGFMVLLAAYRKGCEGDCVEYNPYMVEIGKEVARFLKLDSKVKFFCDEYQNYKPSRSYSVVFSLASHNTADGGIRHGIREHMERIYSVLTPAGTLVFEAQEYEFKDAQFRKSLDSIRDLFSWDRCHEIDIWKREFYIMKPVGK